MPYIQVDETQFPLSIGEVTVGTGADARIRVGRGNDAGPGIQAIVQVGPDGSTAIRRHASAAVIRVNGVQLGGEPTPLIHGDKIEVGGAELLFGDDRKAGSTQYISGLSMPAGADRPEAKATAATGGRVVSLVDGREYMVASTGLVIGRDASCDVVVPSGEVSRRHAEIAPVKGGYVVTDTSANGVLVNGERVRQSQRLGRGDIIKVGNEEFRFYADVPAPVPEPPAAPAPSAPQGTRSGSAAGLAASTVEASHTASSKTASSSTASSSTASSRTASSSTSASSALPPSHTAPSPKLAASSSDSARDARAGAAASAAPAPRGAVLATLEIVNEGVLKGARFDLTSPLVHIGRGAHNDVSIADESVSDSHAKLQRREGVWHVIDLDSTNGTYVAGKRIVGEERVDGTPDLRFGGVKMAFHAGAAGPGDTGKSTRVIAGVSARQARQLGAPTPAVGPVAPAPGSSPEASGRLPLWFWLAVVVLIAAAIIFFMQGRS
jgi:pSer/pThr/pTyr-binding forkhead associated (FHA) protein